MSVYIVLLILALNTVFGVGIFQRNSKKLANRFYAFFVASGNIWILSNFLENEPRLIGIGGLEFFLRLDFFFAIISTYLWFRFVSVFTNYRLELSLYRVVRWIILAMSLCVAGLSFAGETLVSQVHFIDGILVFRNGVFFNIYAFMLTALLFGGIGMLLFARRRASKQQNLNFVHHIDLVLLGSALSIFVALIVNFIQVYHPIPVELSRIGLYGMSFMVVFTAYALASARLFEMRLVILRSVVFLTFAVLLANIVVFSVVLFATSALHIFVDRRTLFVVIAVATLISAGFNSTRELFERATDRLLFRGRYHPDTVLNRVTQTMVESRGIERMGAELLKILKEEFRVKKVGLYFFDSQPHDWISLEFDDSTKELLHKDLSAGILSAHIVIDELPDGEMKNKLDYHEISSIFLIKTNEKSVALLLLGPKLSGDPLHEEDIIFLELLSSEMAIGIQNAQLFSTITRFNKELELRVEERTYELEQSQKQELAKAQEVLRLKDEFVFLAAHELRAPITAIRGFIELSEDNMDQVPDDIRGNLSAIKETSTHLNNLINDLLEVARSETASVSISVTAHSFEPILNQVLSTVIPLLEAKNITLSKNIDPIPLVLCDETKLREVIMNLVSNAIKYNKDGGKIDICATRPAGASHVVFQISDNGFGIPKDRQEKIFQKFFRAGTKGTQDVVGTGLGLFLTRMLVEKMGGTITFSSVEQEGTTFTFTIPISQ